MYYYIASLDTPQPTVVSKVAICLGLTVFKREFHLFQGIMHFILRDDCCNVSYVLEFLNAIGVTLQVSVKPDSYTTPAVCYYQ
jgi:hypothetical protein